MIEREGFMVPLFGIPPAAVLQECDLCHDEKPVRDIQLSVSGQMLCDRCRNAPAKPALKRELAVGDAAEPMRATERPVPLRAQTVSRCVAPDPFG